ncbi:hypothetical protein Cantr_01377 [Candida viswanathii]|uniref:Uncharacterized protein n=1 Tax=Candida viswanathii TaxID=5486 RepID=A0A367YIV3_9ASCO|nr:hypothetical protein Cantr_01377 [Candida viswanathii]
MRLPFASFSVFLGAALADFVALLVRLLNPELASEPLVNPPNEKVNNRLLIGVGPGFEVFDVRYDEELGYSTLFTFGPAEPHAYLNIDSEGYLVLDNNEGYHFPGDYGVAYFDRPDHRNLNISINDTETFYAIVDENDSNGNFYIQALYNEAPAEGVPVSLELVSGRSQQR